jgi:hypothetical protein
LIVAGLAGVLLVAVVGVAAALILLPQGGDGTPTAASVAVSQTTIVSVVTSTSSTDPSEPGAPPTYTPYPTYTSYPTKKPPAPQPPPNPTTTPVPTKPSSPPYSVDINKIEPEPWGRPKNADGCNRPYDDRDPVQRFTIEVILTNHSDQWIPDGWAPEFFSADGRVPPVCVWDYGDTAVEPGEVTYLTFATHTELSDYVQAMVFYELGYEHRTCFNSAGRVVACP